MPKNTPRVCTLVLSFSHGRQCRGRQRKTLGRVIDDLFVSLGLDQAKWLEDIERGESSLASLVGNAWFE